MSEPIDTYRRELARLKASPIGMQIAALESLIVACAKEAAAVKTRQNIPAPVVRPQGRTNGHARPESRKSKIKKAVVQLMKDGGGIAKRQAILEHLKTQNILSGPKAMKVLAPILSGAVEFITDGKGNWSMAPGGST